MDVKRRPRTWVVVADGQQARIYRIGEGGKAVEPVGDALVSEAARLRTHELGSDGPGVVRTGGGMTRAVEPTDWQRLEKERFARHVAGVLNEAAGRKAFDQLVIAAPPRALGDLRASLGEAVIERIKAEVAKDLTGSKPDELLARVAHVLPIADISAPRRMP